MSDPKSGPVDAGSLTRLLRAHRDGDRAAFDELVDRVYRELRQIARRQLWRGQGAGPARTLDSVALVNDAYMRLVEDSGVDWQSRAHFYGVMARAMRNVVVDHARHRAAQKRGSGQAAVELDPELPAPDTASPELVLQIDEVVEMLAGFDQRLARIVECRFFMGMTDDEIGEALGVSARTVQRDWLRARAWLHRTLEPSPAS
jgi:RNA polymerase sigma factor (TIGR02999 family)